MKHDLFAFSAHELPSGMRLYYQHRPLPFFGCKLMIHAGSRHDPPGKEELMHLLEHLLSSGMQGRPKLSLIELERWLRSQRFECSLGETQMDFSAYGGKAATGRLEPLLEFLRDLTLRPTLDSDLEKEREIVRREREEATTPEDRETEVVRRRAVYGPTSRMAAVGGWAEDDVLDALTLDDARVAHRRYYHPGNMSLIVVGGVGEDEVLRTAEKLFSDGDPHFVRPCRPPPMTFAIPDPREHLQRKDGGRVTKMGISYLWHLPPVERLPLVLARSALSDSLMDRIREKLRATYSVDVNDLTLVDHRIFSVTTQVTPKKVDVARAIIEETMRDTEAICNDLSRLKDDYRLTVEFMELDVNETIDRAAQAVNATDARPRTVAEALALLDTIDEAAVAELMTTHLSPERAFVELIEE
jgi:zinc protease